MFFKTGFFLSCLVSRFLSEKRHYSTIIPRFYGFFNLGIAFKALYCPSAAYQLPSYIIGFTVGFSFNQFIHSAG